MSKEPYVAQQIILGGSQERRTDVGSTMSEMVRGGNACANGIFAPLRHAAFRRIWTASLLSNLGLLIMGVGAAWSMTQMTSSPDKVALVQTALMLPVALLST